MGYILNKYYKLRYSIISRDGHVCMEGEPVTIIKKITEGAFEKVSEDRIPEFVI